MEKKKVKPAKSAAGSDEKPEKKKNAKEVTVKLGDKEYTGLCVSKRKTNSGEQVFLKIAGAVSRWFNAKDIVK